MDDDVDAAFVAAGAGRPGPAVLLVPQDLAAEQAQPGTSRRRCLGYWPLDRFRPEQPLIREAAHMLAEARAPVVIAGGGATSPAASRALVSLQEQAGLPVFTTNMGKGAVAETHPLSAGVLGSLTGPGSLGRHTRGLLREADVILLAGTRTNEDGTDGWRLIPPSARIVHADIDPQEIGRIYESLRLVGEAGETLTALAAALGERDLSRRQAARAGLAERIASAWRDFLADRAGFAESDATPLRPERILAEISRCLDASTVVAADASYAFNWVHGQLRAPAAGMRFLTPRGLAGLGWGLPLAIGAKAARPGSRVIAVVGDGGFAHAWAELETMARCRIPVTVVVLNNGVLGYQKDAEQVKHGRYTSVCHLSAVDHAAIARACGAAGAAVGSAAGLGAALDGALASEQPTVLDVTTDPGAHPPVSLYEGAFDQQTASGPAPSGGCITA